MTIKSLQKIISLEDELYAAEQAEQEKAVLWLKDRQAEILRQHEEKLAALEEKREDVKAQAGEEAKQKAAVMVQEAKAQADYLNRIEDSVLVNHLEKILKFIAGQAP